MSFDQWKKLLSGIEECILFLGSELPLQSQEGRLRLPTGELAQQLLDGIDSDDDDDAKLEANNLAQISQRFVAEEDEVELEAEVTRWHGGLRELESNVHNNLAALPFRLIVTSSHDPLLETALHKARKKPAVEYYNYRGRNKELLPTPTIEEPLLFHLYGHVESPSSVVLTETQLLDFLAALISKDPPLPKDLHAELANARRFLFLGFGLQQWYLRILLHVLKVLRGHSRAFAVEALQKDTSSSAQDAIIFYSQNYKIDIQHDDVCAFVEELRSRFTPAEGPKPDEAESVGPEVFISYASENEEEARRVHHELKRGGLQPWLDKESLRGGDRWDDLIESTIKEVDYFVVLNSQELLEKTRNPSYVTKEIKVALRADDMRLGSFIIPAKLDDSELLKQLKGFHAVDLTKDGGPRDLVREIKRQMEATR